MRKPVYAICEQQRCRSACASVQSDQRLCCSLPRSYNTSCLYIPDFKTLASLCSWAGWFVSYQVQWWGSDDKSNKISVRPAKTQISLGIRPVWSETSLCAQQVAKDPMFLHAASEDSDQTGWMLRLIWVFPGRTLILLVLSCRGSFESCHEKTCLWRCASG